MQEYIISSFYKFVNISDSEELRTKLLQCCNKNKLKGTILIASEGINATLVGLREEINLFYDFLVQLPYFHDVQFQESKSWFQPFQKIKIRIKKEIVAFKVDNLNLTQNGKYVSPEDWSQFIQQDDVVLIDTRNYYEIALGTFKNAINPSTNNFSDLPNWIEKNLNKNDYQKKIAMFCTGGIRCEKSTTYLKNLGYKNVYHLKGGILNYLSKTKNQSNAWQGDCFVFDDRIALNTDLIPTYTDS